MVGQGRVVSLSDTLYSVYGLNKVGALPSKKLPQYQPNACLQACLTKLVRTDKGCSEQVGYYYSVRQQESKELMAVTPVRLSRIKSGTLFGYFLYGNRLFLCAGKSDAYLSRTATTDSLTLTPFLSTGPTHDDFYLGGDTDGVLQRLACDDRLPYALIKTCTPQRKRRRNHW